MPPSADLPVEFRSSRAALHLIAAHVLGRTRYQVSGRFGLRASPGGFMTPAFGDGPTTLRVANGTLVRESASGAAYRPIAGSTMRSMARFVGADLTIAFSCGAQCPDLGDIDRPLHVEAVAMQVIADWHDYGWRVLDRVLAALGSEAAPAVVQLWPEHFDVGTSVGISSGQRVNLGASPGDEHCAEPYLYVGPHGDDRGGEPLFWNAPFGAILRRSELLGTPDPRDAGDRFMRRGLAYLDG